MSSKKNYSRLEKKAKNMLSTKEVPPSKMSVVRSLLDNKSLSPDEKYNAVIDIIRTCPDKSNAEQILSDIKIKEHEITEETFEEDYAYDKHLSNYIHNKYSHLKIFKKRYLIHSSNRLGIGIKKRLIPTKKLFKIFREVISFQEIILARLHSISLEIIKDQSIQDPYHFNYLRIFRRWMMETPIIKFNMEEIKWMDSGIFATELQSYIINFFSFFKINTDTKEQIILLIENKVRQIDDLKKEEISADDPDNTKREKEKRNLKKEKAVYEYMSAIRSFLPAQINSENILADTLRTKYSINSLAELLLISSEAFIFKSDTDFQRIFAHYDIKPYTVNRENWDYSAEALKEFGKDQESRIRSHIERLKKDLVPFDEIYSLIKLQINGQNVLQNAFESQWKIADKKQKDYEYVYDDNFFGFIEACLTYFNNSFVPFINGSKLFLEDKNVQIENKVFSAAFFFNELTDFNDLMNQILKFKSENPRIVISRNEAIRVIEGKIKSMMNIQKYIMLAGDLFYQIAEKLHYMYMQHKLWIENGSLETRNQNTTLDRFSAIPESEHGFPIPFHNYKITGFEESRQLTGMLIGKQILTYNAKGGIFIQLTAFCYQLAYECYHDKLLKQLEERKDLMKRIKDLNG